jgi:hypothetical protein
MCKASRQSNEPLAGRASKFRYFLHAASRLFKNPSCLGSLHDNLAPCAT